MAPLPENDDDLLMPLPGEAPPLPTRPGSRRPPPPRPGAPPDRIGPAIEGGVTRLLQGMYDFGGFPRDVVQGKYTPPPRNVGDTYTEEDQFRDNHMHDELRRNAMRMSGYGIGASGMNALMRLIPESLPSALFPARRGAKADEGGGEDPPATSGQGSGDLDSILFGEPAGNTKKPGPTGNLDEILFAPGTPDKVVKPEGFTARVGKPDPDVDYERGAPVGTRLRMFKASNEAEQKLVLKREFGEGNYRKGPDGEWQWRSGSNGKWSTVFPRGVAETLKTGGAYVGALAPKIAAPAAGAVAGAAVGGPFAPLTATLGAMGAAGAGYAADEALTKGLTGTFAKTPMETLGEGGADMLLAGAFQGAKPAWNASKNAVMRGPSWLVRRFAEVDPEAAQLAGTLPPGVTPPVGSLTRKFTLEFDRNMRNQIFGDPMAGPRVAAIDQRMTDILGRMGLQGPQLANAMRAIRLDLQKIDPVEAARGVTDTVARQEANLTRQQQGALQLARETLDRGFQTRATNWARAEGLSERGRGGMPLGQRVINDYQAQGRAFRNQMDVVYGAATDATGNAEIINVPHDIIRGVEPLSIPTNIRNLIDHETGDLRPLTFRDAHRLRTWLRDKAGMRTGDQAPAGQTAGDFHRMAGEVDEAMATAAAEHPGARVARDLLRDADTQYREGVVRFTNQRLNNLAWEVSQGRTPDPGEIANLILDKTSAAKTRQLWDMLTPQTRTAVETSDLNNIIRSASRVGENGQRTIDPEQLLTELDKRTSLLGRPASGNRDAEPFVHDPSLFAALRQNALDMMALNGRVDVTALARGPATSVEIRDHLRAAVQAQEELAQRAAGDAWGAITSQNPAFVQAGADYILKNEGRMAATRTMFGENSPEWQSIRNYAATKLFKDAMVQKPMAQPGVMGRTVSSTHLDDALSGYTAAQQNMLFDPATLDDIRLLVRQANMLFPEASSRGVSQLAAGIQDKMFTKTGMLHAMKFRLFGWLADRPEAMQLLTGAVRQDPLAARGILSWIMQGGATGGSYALTDHTGKGAPGAPAAGSFMDRLRTPKQPLPPEYGGITE